MAPPDVAWTLHAGPLERARVLVNRFIAGFGSFSGRHTDPIAGLHLNPIDWFATLRGAASRSGAAIVDALLELWLVYVATSKNADGSDHVLATADATERAMIATLVAAGDLHPLGRMGYFAANFRGPGFFTDQSWLALANREAAATFTPFTPILTGDDGNPLTRLEGVSDDGAVGYRAEDLDLDVDLMPMIDLAALNQGAVRIAITIRRVVVHCKLTTWSMLDTASEDDDTNGPLAPLTNAFHALGDLIAAGAIANHGDARLRLERPTIVIDVAGGGPSQAPFQGSFVRGVSSIHGQLLVQGWNLAEWALSRVASKLTDAIGRAIAGAIADLVPTLFGALSVDGAWPDGWHATGDVPLTGAAFRFTAGAMTVGAQLAAGATIPAGDGGDAAWPLDPSQSAAQGFAVSRRYLAAWAWKVCADERAKTPLPSPLTAAAFASAMGVTFPLDDLADPSHPHPATPPARRYVVIHGVEVEIVPRALPGLAAVPELALGRTWRVSLPPDGVAHRAGHLAIDYTFSLVHVGKGIVSHTIDGHVTAGPPVRHFVDATVRVEGELVFGLPPGFADPLLPQLSIALRPPSVSIVALTIAAPLTDRARVEAWLETNVLADARQQLAALLAADAAPVQRKGVLPAGLSDDPDVAALIPELVTLRQADHGFTLDHSLAWRVKHGWVTWDLAVDDRLDELFA